MGCQGSETYHSVQKLSAFSKQEQEVLQHWHYLLGLHVAIWYIYWETMCNNLRRGNKNCDRWVTYSSRIVACIPSYKHAGVFNTFAGAAVHFIAAYTLPS